MSGPSNALQHGQAVADSEGRAESSYLSTHMQGQSLADVLERVLDKGIVIVCDIQVRLLDIELLTIKIRLLVASVDKAREIGVDWWESDEFASAQGLEGDSEDGKELASRVEALGERIASDGGPSGRSRQAGESARSRA